MRNIIICMENVLCRDKWFLARHVCSLNNTQLGSGHGLQMRKIMLYLMIIIRLCSHKQHQIGRIPTLVYTVCSFNCTLNTVDKVFFSLVIDLNERHFLFHLILAKSFIKSLVVGNTFFEIHHSLIFVYIFVVWARHFYFLKTGN